MYVDRSEISAKLRHSAETENEWKNDAGWASLHDTNALCEIKCAIHGYYDDGYSNMLCRLADIIDPTCHNFGGEEGTNGENYDFACSACGFCGDIAEPKYCPNCGARVVDDD